MRIAERLVAAALEVDSSIEEACWRFCIDEEAMGIPGDEDLMVRRPRLLSALRHIQRRVEHGRALVELLSVRGKEADIPIPDDDLADLFGMEPVQRVYRLAYVAKAAICLVLGREHWQTSDHDERREAWLGEITDMARWDEEPVNDEHYGNSTWTELAVASGWRQWSIHIFDDSAC